MYSWMAPRRPKPPEHRAVHHDLVIRNAGRDGGGCERGGGALGRHPDLDSVGFDMRGAGLRLHGRVGEERDRVFGFHASRGARERRDRITVGAPDPGFFRREAFAHEGGDAGGTSPEIGRAHV